LPSTVGLTYVQIACDWIMGPSTKPSVIADALSSSPEIHFPGAPHSSTNAIGHHEPFGAVKPSMFEVIFIGCSKPWIHMATSATHTSSIRGITPSIDVLFKGYVKQKKECWLMHR